MEKLKSEYPTNEQIKETLDAHLKGKDALMELILKRRAEAAESDCRDQSDSAVTSPTVA
jgi:hypothetical protein